MATQPENIIQFCLDTEDERGNELKLAPPSGVIQTGIKEDTPVARVWYNFYTNQHAAMALFIQDELLSVGRILTYVNTFQPDFTNDFEGTWNLIGTTTVGGRTLNHYERTA